LNLLTAPDQLEMIPH